VCGAGVGGVVGGAIGAVAGILIAAAAALAIGCATWILCILALVVAVILAVAAVIVGAVLGSQVGRAASAPTGLPIAPEPVASVGDFITTIGDLIISGELQGAAVYFFVNNWIPHGKLPGSPPFSFNDVDDPNLPPDACTRPVPIG
jgi:hypothetical protein